MQYEELGESSKSSLVQLFYIDELERLYPKLVDDFYKKQRNGIKSLMPKNITIDILPKEIKDHITKRITSEFLPTKGRK